MDIPFFYEPQLLESTSIIALSNDTHKHAIQVLRMKVGDNMHLTNGNGLLAKAKLIEVQKKESTAAIENIDVQKDKEKKITLAISLVKNAARFEWMLEKITEIGVASVIPLICERTEKQHFRLDRMQQIIISAMLQSKQCWLPSLQEPTKFFQLIESNIIETNLIAHCVEGNDKITIQSFNKATEMLICIGPEGDFTKEEINRALQKHYKAVSLGNTRLRTETAGLVATTLALL